MALTKISRSLLDTGISDSSDATAITIDSSENVFVGSGTSNGISDGTSGLQVSGAGFKGTISASRHDNNAYGSALMLGKSRNTTVGSNTIIQNGDAIGAIGFFADDGTNLDSQVAYITASVDGTPGANDTPGRLTFSTTADGAASVSERMRIDSSGNVGIGTSSPTSYGNSQKILVIEDSTSPAIAWSDTGQTRDWFAVAQGSGLYFIYGDGGGSGGSSNTTEGLRIENDGGVGIGGPTTINYALEVEGAQIGRGSVYFHTTMPLADATYDLGHSSYRWRNMYLSGTTYSSDRNEKNTIVDSDLGLDFVKRLAPKSYKFNDGTSGRTHYGLIAQDVEDVLSDISKTGQDFAGFCKDEPTEPPKHDKDNPVTETRYGLRYTEFIAPMIKAIQEQQTQIEALQSEINTLKGE
tara:strand:+ start:1045 stop:2274 length:1230 start_codon:yes stop_codon:yes gene_type:complete